MADIIVVLLVAAGVGVVIRKKIMDKKAGKSGCGCGCSGCSGCPSESKSTGLKEQ